MSSSHRWTRSIVVLAPILLAACGSGGSDSQSGATTAASEQVPAEQADISKDSSSAADAQQALGELLELHESTDHKEAADRLEATLDALRAASEELPRDTFDPTAVVSQVGHDPGAIFAWVRDRTALVPYRGVLRGPRGVLLDRFGNSLDRSLLLAQLLQLSGGDVRLANATLQPDKTEVALKQAMLIPAQPPVPSADGELKDNGRRIDDLADSLEVDADELRSRLKAVHDEADRVARNATTRSKEQSSQLQDILTAKPSLASLAKESSPAIALADHWWVQLRQDGRWVDLDPVLLRSGPGKSMLDAEATFEPQALHDDIYHRLRIRVIIERASEGRLEEQTVLEHTLRLSATIGVPITLEQFPSHIAPAPPDPSAESMAQHYQMSLDEQQEWIPVLTIGNKSIFQSSFTLAGEIQSPGSTLSLSVPGAFFDALGGGESESATSHLTAEFIEYEFSAPGKPPRVERRTLIDVLGPSVREQGNIPPAGNRRAILGLDLLQETELLPVVAQPSPSFVAHMSAESLLSAGDRLVGLLRNNQTGGSSALDYIPAELYDLALARHEWSHVAQSVVITAPNLLTRHVGLRENAGGLTRWSAFDIVVNDVNVRDGSPAQRRSIRIAQGVVDTNAETLLLPDHHGTGNVAELMAIDRGAGVSWSLVEGEPIGEKLAEALSSDRLARIKEDLSRGYVAVVPVTISTNGAVEGGWWRVDPVSGTVLGIDSLGRGGSATTEEVEAEVNALQSARASMEFYKLFGCAFADTLLAVSIAQKTNSNALGAGAALPGLAYCIAAAPLKIHGLIGGAAKVTAGRLSLFGDLLGLASWSYRAAMGLWAKSK